VLSVEAGAQLVESVAQARLDGGEGDTGAIGDGRGRELFEIAQEDRLLIRLVEREHALHDSPLRGDSREDVGSRGQGFGPRGAFLVSGAARSGAMHLARGIAGDASEPCLPVATRRRATRRRKPGFLDDVVREIRICYERSRQPVHPLEVLEEGFGLA
jgi:hypothetical protein